MREGICTKKFPKHFQTCTSTGDDGYPKYRRLSSDSGGITAILRNNEVHKFKDEIQQLQSGRNICSSEAVWGILSFSGHERAPSIVHLTIHLENEQRVYFTVNNASDIVNNPRDITLTGFFKLCIADDFSKYLTYDKVPVYYTWNATNRKFQRRKQSIPVDGYDNVKKSDTLGRVNVIHSINSECFHLRILLHVVKGPTSFEYLRTVDGITYNTFQAACRAMELLESDSHFENILSEAALYSLPTSLRTCISEPSHLSVTLEKVLFVRIGSKTKPCTLREIHVPVLSCPDLVFIFFRCDVDADYWRTSCTLSKRPVSSWTIPVFMDISQTGDHGQTGSRPKSIWEGVNPVV
ncbi:hypothetical protein HNY73_008849 [Argiope bruennichi]|uniref:Uncharacterized protein n=1 Tax=Argiope bruennichi TaxID=94029 RepID=A0A8T0F7S6_ARGBR|nr:hypothetical protein HNY73_008849 [Argiope bruennichi]